MRYIPIKLKNGQIVDVIPPRNKKTIKRLRNKRIRRESKAVKPQEG